MAVVRVGPKHQITIPREIFKKLNLEVGDLVEAEIVDNGVLFIPHKLIPKDQAWFWTKEWQEGEKEAEEDIREGRLAGPFSSVREFKRAVKARK